MVKLISIRWAWQGALGRWSHAWCKPSMQVSMATLRTATTQHRDTDKSVEILTNPHTYQDYMMKTRRGWESGRKKERKTGNENVAATWYKGPCNNAQNMLFISTTKTEEGYIVKLFFAFAFDWSTDWINWLKHFDSCNTYLWHPWQVLWVMGSADNHAKIRTPFLPYMAATNLR